MVSEVSNSNNDASTLTSILNLLTVSLPFHLASDPLRTVCTI